MSSRRFFQGLEKWHQGFPILGNRGRVDAHTRARSQKRHGLASVPPLTEVPRATARIPAGMRLMCRMMSVRLGLGAIIKSFELAPLDLRAQHTLDPANHVLVFRGQEREGVAGLRGAARTADPVRVIIHAVRHVEVDDVGDGRDVDAARGDVGRDEDLELAAAEAFHRRLPLALGEISLDARGAVAGLGQALRQPLRALLRSGEDEDGLAVRAFQDRQQQGRLEVLRNGEERVRHGLRRLGMRDLKSLRISQNLVRQLADRVGHRGREQQRLPLGREPLQNLPDIRKEPHVEHAVGFVQHEAFHVGQVDRALPDMIQQAAGTGDRDFGAVLEPGHLGPHAHAAVDRHAAKIRVRAEVVHGLESLFGQLAGRADNQHAKLAARAAHQPMQNRDSKRGGLARARLGQADDIVPLENHRDGLALNGRRDIEAQLPDVLPDMRIDFQQIETHADPLIEAMYGQRMDFQRRNLPFPRPEASTP